MNYSILLLTRLVFSTSLNILLLDQGSRFFLHFFISFLISPWFIRKLQKKQIGQVVRNDGPESHFSKAGTPTMGGGLIIFAVIFPSLLWMDLGNHLMWYALTIFAGYGTLGFFRRL